MSSITLFAATDLEYRAFVSLLDGWKPIKSDPLGGVGWCGENRIELFRTAMGPDNAAMQASRALARAEAGVVLVSGLAGALSPECRSGDLVLYRQCHFIEGKDMIAGTTGCDGNFTDQLRDRLHSLGLRFHEGDGLTLPRVICSASEKREVGLRHSAIAVDMESYQILNVAEKSGYPKAVLRVISDDLQHDLPDINAGLDPKARVKNLRMLASLGAHPLLAARFLFNIRRALEQLKPALRSVLEAAYTFRYINCNDTMVN